jgi:hypothetical protein
MFTYFYKLEKTSFAKSNKNSTANLVSKKYNVIDKK